MNLQKSKMISDLRKSRTRMESKIRRTNMMTRTTESKITKNTEKKKKKLKNRKPKTPRTLKLDVNAQNLQMLYQ